MDELVLENVISLQELINYLTEIITNIRANSQNYQKLQKLVQELETYAPGAVTKRLGASNLFTIYKNIINVSMELRKALSSFDIEIKQYDSIDYVFYYNGKPYYTNELKPEWLSATKGGLMVSLSKAIKEIETDYNNELLINIQETFQRHYQLLVVTVDESYRRHHNGHSFSEDRTFNKGHLAEAHERHLQEHHSNLYIAAKTKQFSESIIEQLQSALANMQSQNEKQYWHEAMGEFWQEHLLPSLGYQRGTVAGDVGSTQVKSGGSGSSSLRLSKVGNLRMGIKAYSNLFNEDITPYQAATIIAGYMSDAVNKDARSFINRTLLPQLTRKGSDLGSLLATFEDKFKDIKITI